MEINALTAGVEPGGLNNTEQIKLLVCYLLKSYGPLQREVIVEAALHDGLVNYFEMHNAINVLLNKSYISEKITDNAEYLILTESGGEIIAQLESMLPLSVKEKAVKAAMDILTLLRRKREIKFKLSEEKNGYYLYYTIDDNGRELTTIKLLVPNNETAKILRNRLSSNDPSLIYRSVVALLTGDMETFTEYFSSVK